MILMVNMGYLEKTDGYKGFIGKNKRVITTEMYNAPGVLFDDDTVYELLIKSMIQNKSTFGTLPLFSLQNTVKDYLGKPAIGDQRNMRMREKRKEYGKDSSDDPMYEISISELKDSGAECSEFATLSHNLISFCGFEDELVSGICNMNGQAELHAFNIITINGVRYLYDSANELVVCTKQGQKGTLPCYERITDDEYEAMLSGKGYILKGTLAEQNGYTVGEGFYRNYGSPNAKQTIVTSPNKEDDDAR